MSPGETKRFAGKVGLFRNGNSLGRKKKGNDEYRLRWEEVVYEPVTHKAVIYKDGKSWAVTEPKTAGEAAALQLSIDRRVMAADGADLCFVTVAEGLTAASTSISVKTTVGRNGNSKTDADATIHREHSAGDKLSGGRT